MLTASTDGLLPFARGQAQPSAGGQRPQGDPVGPARPARRRAGGRCVLVPRRGRRRPGRRRARPRPDDRRAGPVRRRRRHQRPPAGRRPRELRPGDRVVGTGAAARRHRRRGPGGRRLLHLRRPGAGDRHLPGGGPR
ncbi:hypothetical protein [Ornithinimicrobium kibberense]|uniref:hypothetical protein n=1 Tax=Ornithinimicrobium kibberense TaxID=282060 RepID=UPI003613DA26